MEHKEVIREKPKSGNHAMIEIKKYLQHFERKRVRYDMPIHQGCKFCLFECYLFFKRLKQEVKRIERLSGSLR